MNLIFQLGLLRISGFEKRELHPGKSVSLGFCSPALEDPWILNSKSKKVVFYGKVVRYLGYN